MSVIISVTIKCQSSRQYRVDTQPGKPGRKPELLFLSQNKLKSNFNNSDVELSDQILIR